MSCHQLAAAALAMLLLAAAAARVEALDCGPNAAGAECPGSIECCSIWGYCGTGPQYCGKGACLSGACQRIASTPPEPSPKPQPRPIPVPKPQPATGHVIEVSHGGTALLKCSGGRVITGFWGMHYGNVAKKCSSPLVYRVVSAACLRRADCSFQVTLRKFGNPCPGIRKSLRLGYRCGTPHPSPKPPSPKPRPTPKPVPQPSPGSAYYSPFFGRSGELWKPWGRMADWSYAGYMALQASLPDASTFPAKFNVKDYGAKGDGKTDDSKAIQAAVDAASEAAVLLNTYDCSTRYRQRQCMLPHNGFQNQGKQGVAVLLPPGTYLITQSITITQSNVVLRGSNKKNTVLYMPKSLSAIYGKRQAWSFGGGFVIIDGNNAGSNQEKYKLTRVTADADKGQQFVKVETTDQIQVGQWVRLYALAPSPAKRRRSRSLLQSNITAHDFASIALDNRASPSSSSLLPLSAVMKKQLAVAAEYAASEVGQDGVRAAAQGGTLDAYLYGDNLVDSGSNAFYSTDHIRFAARVVAKGADWIKLERPLTYNIRTRWMVHIYAFYATVQHSGVEHLTFKFAHDIYPCHLCCKGYNAIILTSVANCWVHNIDIINADNGIIVTGSDFVSVRHIAIKVEKPRWNQDTMPDNGHHALMLSRSADVSFRFFYINSRYRHDLSLDGFAERNVYASGSGVDMNLDLHRAGSHNNLFSYLRLGKGTRAFYSGGYKTRGAYSGSNNTFWNVAPLLAGAGMALPSCEFGPLLNFIGNYLPPTPSRVSRYEVASAAGAATVAINGTSRGSSMTDGGMAVNIADAANPSWCPSTHWRVNVVPPGQHLYPANLFDAMVQARRQRLV